MRRHVLALVAVEVLMSDVKADHSLLPKVEVVAPASVLQGFPLLVALTLHNDEPGTDYYGLAVGDLYDGAPPVEAAFVDDHGHAHRVRCAAPPAEEPGAGGLTLKPRQSYTMLLELPVEAALAPGSYRVELWYVSDGRQAARPFTLRVERPTDGDAAAAAALRAHTDEGESSWRSFLTANWRTVDATHLSLAAHKALALHLFLHRAAYGPQPPAQLSEAPLAELAVGPTEGEAALLKLEILTARHDPRAVEQQAELARRFPGLRWRVDEILAGHGRLARARRDFGAERAGAPPGRRPYALER